MAGSQTNKLGWWHAYNYGEGGWNTGFDFNWRKLDALVQASILDKDLTAPPGSPAGGDCYIVGASATGAWASKDGQIARYSSTLAAWEFFVPSEGWWFHVNDEDKFYKHNGTSWEVFTSGGGGGSSLTINQQTGTSYTLALTDKNTLVEMANASANTLTVPPNSSVAFSVGDQIHVRQDGAGQTTIAAGSGVTINYVGSLSLRTQGSLVVLIKRATDAWDMVGDTDGLLISNKPIQTGQYTLSTLPSVSTYQNYLITVTNATGGPALCISNGTNWINIRTNTTVS